MKRTMDGCTAATYVAYALSDVATIYPISPIAEMGEIADKWGVQGRLNVFGTPMRVKELESELGAAGATHGALCGGALATTFTCSQGLMLMIPNMYRMAGEMLPAVFHVGTRVVGSHALSIFGDHSDVMECRATGFAMLASCSVQETLDLAIVAHLSAIDSSLPVLHFFDGWRTANEMQSIDAPEYEALKPLVDMDRVKAFRARAMNPERPDLRGTAQNPDIYFQNREARNRFYDVLPGIVQKNMEKVSALTGRSYHLFEYYGDPEAELVTISMASSSNVIKRTIADLNAKGYKCGHINVRLFRPFATEAFLALLPKTAKKVITLDRTRENGAQGEPLYMDVCCAMQQAGNVTPVLRGRYGLGSKEFNPAMVKAIFDNARADTPKREFTVGIDDDVTHLSLTVDDSYVLEEPKGSYQAIFYGFGSDGTVGSTKQAATILNSVTDACTQAYFHYSAKKSGGYTISQLRVEDSPVDAPFNIENADYVGCNKDRYTRLYDLLQHIRPGGTFVLNSRWTLTQMDKLFPASLKRAIVEKKVKFYNVNAVDLAQKYGLGSRINMIMLTVFFHLSGLLPDEKSVEELKQSVSAAYEHEGENVVQANCNAIDAALSAAEQINYPQSWAQAEDTYLYPIPASQFPTPVPEWIKRVAWPMLRLRGHLLPVSLISPDGVVPVGTTAYERRTIAVNIPHWDVQKCIECAQCSLVCSHAAIRPYLATEQELADAPESYVTKDTWNPALKPLKWRIQVYPQDCTGCGSCATVCPAGALTMVPLPEDLPTERTNLQFAQTHISTKEGRLPRNSVLGSQLYPPLFQFSGACGGCGETPYIKLVTQLFGEHIVIANATGCSSVYGGDSPSHPYCTNCKGHGPAWGNSLFEDNAEYGYGIAVALRHRREQLISLLTALLKDTTTPQPVKDAINAWNAVREDYDKSYPAGVALRNALTEAKIESIPEDLLSLLGRKAVWAFGGDGWAYDIGFAGLDHVLASGENINILVLDTQCYSNTGGQSSKATPYGACMKYNYDGKPTHRKMLAEMMLTYKDVYVASIALGANMCQAIQALTEAEAYEGPSIVVAYCPCINWGIKSHMSHTILEERDAVFSNFWSLFRYNPDLQEPMTKDLPVEATPGTGAGDPYGDKITGLQPIGDAPAISEKAFWKYTPRPTPAFSTLNGYTGDMPPYKPIPVSPMLMNENRYAVLSARNGESIAQKMIERIQAWCSATT